MQKYAVFAPDGSIILFTIRYRVTESTEALANLKGQSWEELQAEGYKVHCIYISLKPISTASVMPVPSPPACDCGAIDEDDLAPHADDCPCRPDDTHTLAPAASPSAETDKEHLLTELSQLVEETRDEDYITLHLALICDEITPDEARACIATCLLPPVLAPAASPSANQTAKQDFLLYKAEGGKLDGLEWCYENEPELFARWQNEGQISGDWIYYEV